jgi:hypothetical protein
VQQDQHEEQKELAEISKSIDQQRAERLRKYLPRWFQTYRKFRSAIFLFVILAVDLALFYLLFGEKQISFSSLLLFLFVYPIVSIADRVVGYLAVRSIPPEVYYQDELHY